MSEYDRRTGVKNLRVRGLKAVRFCVTLKAIGVNIFRAIDVRKVANDDKAAHERKLSFRMHAIFVIKKHLQMAISQLGKFLSYLVRSYEHMIVNNAQWNFDFLREHQY
jgi:hypothetical protein